MSAKHFPDYRDAFRIAKQEHILQVMHPYMPGPDRKGDYRVESAVLICYHTRDDMCQFAIRSMHPGRTVRFSSSLREAIEEADSLCREITATRSAKQEA
jgi:hypothetical protein